MPNYRFMNFAGEQTIRMYSLLTKELISQTMSNVQFAMKVKIKMKSVIKILIIVSSFMIGQNKKGIFGSNFPILICFVKPDCRGTLFLYPIWLAIDNIKRKFVDAFPS